MNLRQTLNDLRNFVQAEHKANQQQLQSIWQKPLATKLGKGETQRIVKVVVEGKSHLLLTLGEGESRFREGDMICVHRGQALDSTFIHQATIEAEQDDEWLVRTVNQDLQSLDLTGPFFVDTDAMDLKPFYEKALDEVAASKIGRECLLPLLAGALKTSSVNEEQYDASADFAEECGLNEKQAEAVGLGVAAKYAACIQGPPGTGKTKVISLIVKCLVADGQRVFITSHTHMAINNALNKISEEGVPVAKICAVACVKGLNSNIKRFESGSDWDDRPDSGYVIGATPFATCTARLDTFEFDTVIFDEASQITVALAVMAMRKAKRFIFVGDHQQLPPVVLSASVLNKQAYSVFSRLVLDSNTPNVILERTYRMNKELSRWPSSTYYKNRLTACGENAERRFTLPNLQEKFSEILSDAHAFVYIKSPGLNAKTSSYSEAKLVVDIIASAALSGLSLHDIGVVTPYRSHGKMIRKLIAQQLGFGATKQVVTDTVERMQGQERELIVISLCTTDPVFLRAVAKFFFQSERLNVAITRPKTKLILIGPELDSGFVVDAADVDLQLKVNDYQSLIESAHKCEVPA